MCVSVKILKSSFSLKLCSIIYVCEFRYWKKNVGYYQCAYLYYIEIGISKHDVNQSLFPVLAMILCYRYLRLLLIVIVIGEIEKTNEEIDLYQSIMFLVFVFFWVIN